MSPIGKWGSEGEGRAGDKMGGFIQSSCQESNVASTAEHLGPSRVKLTVDIPFTELKPHLDRTYQEIAKQITIPGFRKGKVPPAVIDQRFGRGAVLQDAINDALPQAYGAAIEEAKVVPLGEPDVEVTKLEDGDVVEFTAEVDVRPDFEVPDAAGITVTVDPLPDLDTDVAERIELLRSRFATTTDVDRPAEKGDQVMIDLVASRDGEPLENGSSEGVTYVIGTEGMLDGLEEAVTGLSAGESAQFSSTLVGGEFEGEPADIAVTVTKVSSRELPEVDDDFAQLVSEFDTADEMRADLAKNAEAYARMEQASKGRDKVFEALVDATDFEVPEAFLAAEVASRREQIEDQLGRAGLSLEDYLERADETAKTPDEFWAQLEADTVRALKGQLILDKIAEDAEVSVEQSDLSELLVRKAMQNGTSPEQEVQHMMEHNHAAAWMQEIRRNKALAFVVGKATVTDTNGQPVDVTMAVAVPEGEEDEDESE